MAEREGVFVKEYMEAAFPMDREHTKSEVIRQLL